MAGVGILRVGAIASALIVSAPVYAAATSFDCDVPPDHFSFVSQDVTGPLMIRGSIEPVQMRSGKNLPVAGARLISSDGNDEVAFQLLAASSHAKQFDVVLIIRHGDDLQQNTVGQVAAGTDAPISFSLMLDSSGRATLAVGGANFSASFVPLTSGKEMAFCSTAEFKFTGLLFSSDDMSSAPAPQ